MINISSRDYDEAVILIHVVTLCRSKGNQSRNNRGGISKSCSCPFPPLRLFKDNCIHNSFVIVSKRYRSTKHKKGKKKHAIPGLSYYWRYVGTVSVANSSFRPAIVRWYSLAMKNMHAEQQTQFQTASFNFRGRSNDTGSTSRPEKYKNCIFFISIYRVPCPIDPSMQ